MCQRNRLGHIENFALASWIRFSPNTVKPISAAARTTSGGCPLLTGRSRTEFGDRPTRAQAAAIFSLTFSRFAFKSMGSG
jgi:hypothetical protein